MSRLPNYPRKFMESSDQIPLFSFVFIALFKSGFKSGNTPPANWSIETHYFELVATTVVVAPSLDVIALITWR